MNETDRALLTALLERIVSTRDGLYRLSGPIGPSEYKALHRLAARPLSGRDVILPPTPPQTACPTVTIDTALLSATPIRDGCLCIDFGTAASKAAFEPGGDRFEPLPIGADQGGDPFWVRSAIAFDAAGRIVFGDRALESANGAGAVTSFKSKLWGDPAVLDEVALDAAGISFSYRDCVQAYLGYLTLLATRQLIGKALSRWTPRRYAMPFAYDDERRGIREALGTMLGRAALLADTLNDELIEGVAADRMRAALDALAGFDAPAWLHASPSCVGEPVAAGAFALDQETRNLTVYMIVDIGAGTTDFCVMCIKKTADGTIQAIQAPGGSLSIEIAGDEIDRALVEHLLAEQAGEEHRARLSLEAAGLKERLFALRAADDEQIDLQLGATILDVSRQGFLASSQWRTVVDALRQAQARCFDQMDRAYLQNYGTGAIRVVLTGGGATLPLAEELTCGVSPGEIKVARTPASDLPLEVRDRFAAIAERLPRLAVALGGSRDMFPDQQDRSAARTDSRITAPFVWSPLNKSDTGLDAA